MSRIDTPALTLLQQFQRPASSSTQAMTPRLIAGAGLSPAGVGSSTPSSQAAAAIGAASIDWAAKAQGRAAELAEGLQMMDAHLTWLRATPGSSTQSDRMKAIESATRGMSMIEAVYEYYASGGYEESMAAKEAFREIGLTPEHQKAEAAKLIATADALREQLRSK
ncbi:hypothetical protein [Mesorhizobium sp. CAU 1741]|uniref:hypothetical protein n=1 Tax=Mesorhizobium sp. CAU 1741 TaxID=3140366 RepID=UPI00325C1C98